MDSTVPGESRLERLEYVITHVPREETFVFPVTQQFFEFSPDAILFTDAHGDIRAANRQAKPLYRVARTAMHE